MSQVETLESGNYEHDRLAALRRYGVLDTDPESRFDDIATLASHICAVPIALVVFIDENRAWFKSRIGMTATEVPRELAFCSETIRQKTPLIVPNLPEDPRFAQNPLVTGDLGVRFYAAAPLLTPDGFAIGTLCLLDQRPRHLSPDQLHALSVLRDQVIMQLELGRRLKSALYLSEELEADIHERANAVYDENRRRREAENELRALSLRLLSIQEEERTRLAREVHDNLGQQLTSLTIDIHRVKKTFPPSEEGTLQLTAMEQTVNDSIDIVRRISTELRPAVLDDLGLIVAIRGELQRFEERINVRAVLEAQEDMLEPSREQATALFRILQEALTNIVRHAQAQQIQVTLKHSSGSFIMTVRDDGIGIDARVSNRPTSLGLIGIRERTHQLSGAMSLGMHPDGGTLLRISLPMEGHA